MNEKEQIIKQIKKEVYDLLGKDNSGHGIEHINRVYNLSMKFAAKEKSDIFITSLIALLHDVDDYKLFGSVNAEELTNAKTIMNKYNIDLDIQEKVSSAIGKIGYKKSLNGIRPNILEGMIVSDADMCDSIGVTGILRTYDYQKSHGKPFFDKTIFPNENVGVNNYKLCSESAVCHCFEKLLRLKDLMLTTAGKEEANSRHNILVDMLYHLFEEEDALQWKEYLDEFLKR